VRPVKQETLDKLEHMVGRSCDQIEALFDYEGDDDRAYGRLRTNAKSAGVIITGFGRVVSAENNREMIARMPIPEQPERLQSA
jgi:hypothetical protein